AKGNAIFISIFAGESKSAGQRNVGTYDGVSTIHVMFLIEEMHRTTESTGTTGIFAEKFGHAGIGAGSADQRVGMIAIGGDKVIIEPNSRDRAGHDRLLADIKMTEAADFLDRKSTRLNSSHLGI